MRRSILVDTDTRPTCGHYRGIAITMEKNKKP